LPVEFDPARHEPQDVDLPDNYPVPEGWIREVNPETGWITRLWPPGTVSAEDMEQKNRALAEFEKRKMNIRASFDNEPAPLDMILPGMVAGTVGMIAGAGSAGKSMWSVQCGMSIAYGYDVFGLFAGVDGFAFRQGRVVYACAEDQRPVLHHRFFNMAQRIREADPLRAPAILNAIVQNFEVVDLYGSGVAIESKRPDWWNSNWWLLAQIAKGARLVILDTLIRFAGGRSENDNVEMAAMMSAVEMAVKSTGSTFLLLHHVGKASARDGTAGTDQTAVRGASSLTDNARWQANLQTMTVQEATKRGIDEPDERRRWVSWEATKTNYGPPLPVIWLYRGPSGILFSDDPPDPLNGRGRV
jgi:regulatory protein RepA